MVGAWALLAGLILCHGLLVTNDSVSNYAHVWFIEHQLRHGYGLPLTMPVLGHGRALAYPYAFVPWTAAAALGLVAGDWATTLTLVAGAALIIWATFWALPELRKPGLAALVLLNPFLIESVILGQLPFLWAAGFLFAAIGAWRRQRLWIAVALGAAAQATHPAVMMPLALGLVGVQIVAGAPRRHLVVGYLASVVLALPAAYMVFASPVLSDAGRGAALINLVGTVSIRSMVVLIPVAFAMFPNAVERRPAQAAMVLVAAFAVLTVVRQDEFAWESLLRTPDHSVRQFTSSASFAPDATYRVLNSRDGKMAMYDVLRDGGRLDSEFFPESIERKSWPDVASYAAFLASRHVEFVVIYDRYMAAFRTNEEALIEGLSSAPGAGARAERVFRTPDFQVFKITTTH